MTAGSNKPERRVRLSPMLLTACVALALSAAEPSWAQPVGPGKGSGTAECRGENPEQLYKQGYDFWTQGDQSKACNLFFLSYRCGPGSGNTFNWARCNEQMLNDPAAAYRLYLEAAKLATTEKNAVREKAAREAVDKLAARITLVTLHLAPGPLPYSRDALKVSLNNETIPVAEFDKPRPVRPGSCRLEVSAKGYRTWRYTVLAVPGRQLDIPVPRLEALPVAPPPSAVPTSTAPTPSATPMPTSTSTAPEPGPDAGGGPSTAAITGYVTGGVGLALLVVGGILGGLAISHEKFAADNCPDKRCNVDTDPGNEAWEGLETAKKEAAGATATVVLGTLSVGTGLALLLASDWSGADGADRAETSGLLVLPYASERGGGLVIGGVF